MSERLPPADMERPSTHVGEVLRVFLRLGLTSFGGPVAHLGYFRDEFVTRRGWISEAGFADLVALCQILPGPASSQVGFALGLIRGGSLGALAAWVAFTMPSALALTILAVTATSFEGSPFVNLLYGLKIVAVAVVAQAIWGMARSLAPDRTRATIALVGLLAVTVVPNALGQLSAIATGAFAGMLICKKRAWEAPLKVDFFISRRVGVTALALFVILLAGLPLLASVSGLMELELFDAFYRSGAFVFGGGHVVLPLLQTQVVQSGWVTNNTFLEGYGATQAMPGPLFTFAAYLGASLNLGPHGVTGALIGLIAIFLPGLLLLVGTLPFWNILQESRVARAAMDGANASVVGLLVAALYNPVWISAIHNSRDFFLAVFGFVLLTIWKVPPWVVVILLAASGLLF